MLKDLVLKNRSYRGFDESVRISRETLEGFVDCARLCPSSVNKQPLKYFLAWEPEEVEKVQGLTKWARALPDMVLPHPGKRPTGFVVICQDKRIDENLNRYQKDVGIVAQTMLLAAVEQGLGGCMIGNFQAGEVMEVTWTARGDPAAFDCGVWKTGGGDSSGGCAGGWKYELLPG